MRIDTHVHSTYSDGLDDVRQLFQLAKKANLDAIALTDHDTNAGWAEAQRYAQLAGVGFIAGAEISSSYENGDSCLSIHMLAYLYDETNVALQDLMHDSRMRRYNRFVDMVDRVKQDYDISVDTTYTGKPLGLPQIADALVTAGYFPNRDKCFEKVLGVNSKYYIPYKTPDVFEVIELVKGAGGFCVVAHPFSSKRHQNLDFSAIVKMKQHGLGGIEVNHREHNWLQRQNAYKLSLELDLLPFGASDFHGKGKPNFLGENLTSYSVVEQMQKHTFRKVNWNWSK